MHRNSVIYRMKQIEEILDFDFSSMEFGFHIDLSFRILDLWSRSRAIDGAEKRTAAANDFRKIDKQKGNAD